MSTIIVVDIETKVSSKGLEYLNAKEYEPDARLKDPEKIKASIEQQKQKEIDQAALYWWLSKIICICAINYETQHAKTFSGDDERFLLRQFFAHLESSGSPVTVIGKSSAQFDIPFIVGRALALNMGLPECFKQRVENLNDIDQIFSRYRMCSQVTSLENYAFGLGVNGKLGRGSDVAKMHEDGRWQEIESYCQRDTEIVCEMLKRYQKPFVGGGNSYA